MCYLISAIPAGDGNPIIEVCFTNNTVRTRVPAGLVIVEGLADVAFRVLVANTNVRSL